MTTNKLLPLTTFVAAAMSFALPAYADDYTWAGEDNSSSDTYLLRYLKEADEDLSAIKLGEKKDPLAFDLHDTSAVSEGSDGFARGSILASSGGGILERVEITKTTVTNLNRALTLTPVTNTSDDTVTVRQSVVAMSPIFEEASEQYTESGKSYYEQVSTSNSGSALTTYSTVSLLGNFDSTSNSDSQYGISYLSNDDGSIDGGIVYLAAYTWTGDGTDNYWTGSGNWSGSTWSSSSTSNSATFGTNSEENTTVIVDRDITATSMTVNGGVDYTFNYANDSTKLTVTGNITIDGGSSLTITGGTNELGTSANTKYFYLGYSSDSSGTLNITGGTNTFEGSGNSSTFYLGYSSDSSGTLNITDGTNTFSGSNLYIGNGSGSTGTITITNGTNTFSSSNLYIGNGSGSTGTITIKGGTNTFSRTNAAMNVYIGNSSGSTGTIEIYDGYNNFTGANATSSYLYIGYASDSTGYLKISGGTNTFTSTNFPVYVGYNGTGKMEITSGNNTFGTVYVGGNSNGSGEITITGGENIFSGSNVHVGYNGTGTMEISGGTNTFSGNNFYVGNHSTSGNGTITITGGKNTFSAHIYIGNSSSTSNADTMTITGGTTTISGLTTIYNGSSLTIGDKEAKGKATVYLETKIGTTTNGSVTISDNAKIILSGDLLKSIEALLDTTGSIPVIMANTISFGDVTLGSGSYDLDSLVNQYVSAEGYQLTWDYHDNTLYVVSVAIAPIPEPSMFGLFFSIASIGLVATRRRRRRKA